MTYFLRFDFRHGINALGTLVWLAVLGFLAKWYLAYQTGNLEAGQGTTLRSLVILFAIGLAVSVAGVTVGVRGWIRPVRMRWLVVSLVVSLLALWAVAGG